MMGRGRASASLIMIAAVALLSWRQKLRLERDLAIAVGRSLTQMLLVGAALGLIVDADHVARLVVRVGRRGWSLSPRSP